MNNPTLEQVLKDRKLRIALAKKSHYWFFHIYFSRYVTYKTAPFHKELFHITENEEIKNAVIVAFRGSGKSTIMTLSYPIWAILGQQSKKYIVIIGQTQQQTRLILSNIKQELETNNLLISDFGPFGEQHYEWSLNSLTLPQFTARIDGYSSGESIRGIRHGEYRPQLILADDIEDLQSVRTKEARDKAYDWYTGDILGLGDKDTKIINIGNLLHEDSLIKKRMRDIREGRVDGIIKEIPLVDNNGNILWLGKYPTLKDVEQEKKRVGNEKAWQREYLLKIISDEEQLVKQADIMYYDELPKVGLLMYYAISLDPAISLKDTGDKTGIVSGAVYELGGKKALYILPNIVNQRLTSTQTVMHVKTVFTSLGGRRAAIKIFVEDVAYQRALVELIQKEGLPAQGVGIQGQDKHARLSIASHLIRTSVLYPREGADELIKQTIYFGSARFDDLVDASTLLIMSVFGGDDSAEVWSAYIKSDTEKRQNMPEMAPEGFILNLLKPYGFKGMI